MILALARYGILVNLLLMKEEHHAILIDIRNAEQFEEFWLNTYNKIESF